MALPTEPGVELLKFWGMLYKICLLLLLPLPFPSQIENTQVALSEERRSEGKVGFKAYRNYLTAGAHWFVIVFLILLNIASQVNRAFILFCGLSLITVLLTLYVFTLLLPYFAVHLDLHGNVLSWGTK